MTSIERVCLLDGGEGLETVHPRHLDIEDDDIGSGCATPGQGVESLLAAVGGIDLHAPFVKAFDEGLDKLNFIVDDED